MTCTIWQSLTPAQRDELRHWATDGLVRMFERGEVGFDFLCDIQAWAGVGGGAGGVVLEQRVRPFNLNGSETMYKVCDDQLRILSEWSSLAAAKAAANIRATEYRNQTFLVFDHTGQCVAGYTVA